MNRILKYEINFVKTYKMFNFSILIFESKTNCTELFNLPEIHFPLSGLV